MNAGPNSAPQPQPHNLPPGPDDLYGNLAPGSTDSATDPIGFDPITPAPVLRGAMPPSSPEVTDNAATEPSRVRAIGNVLLDKLVKTPAETIGRGGRTVARAAGRVAIKLADTAAETIDRRAELLELKTDRLNQAAEVAAGMPVGVLGILSEAENRLRTEQAAYGANNLDPAAAEVEVDLGPNPYWRQGADALPKRIIRHMTEADIAHLRQEEQAKAAKTMREKGWLARTISNPASERADAARVREEHGNRKLQRQQWEQAVRGGVANEARLASSAQRLALRTEALFTRDPHQKLALRDQAQNVRVTKAERLSDPNWRERWEKSGRDPDAAGLDEPSLPADKRTYAAARARQRKTQHRMTGANVQVGTMDLRSRAYRKIASKLRRT